MSLQSPAILIKKVLVVLTWVLPLLVSHISLAQVNLQEGGLPFITNYGASTYHAGIQNFDIVQDELGRIFVANNLGLLEFDGKNWFRYGLNNTKVRSAFVSKDNRIFVGSQGDFGFLEANGQGKLEYTSLADSLPSPVRDFDETWKVFGSGESVYFCTFERIYVYHGQGLDVIDPGKRLDISFQVANQVITQLVGEGLFEVNLEGLNPIRNGNFFKDKRVSTILPFDQNTWLVSTFSHGLFLYDGNVRPFPLQGNFWKNEYLINYSTRLKNGNIALATQNAGLFVIDKEGKLLNHLDKDAGLMDLTINYIFEDSQQGLWLAMNNGVARVDLFSPFSVINKAIPISTVQGAWIVKAHPKNPDFYIQGTYTGLSLFKKVGGRLQFIQKIKGFEESSRVMEFDGTTLWVAHGYKGVYRITLSEDLGTVLESKLYNSAHGFPNDVLINVFKAADRLLFTANGGIYQFDQEKERFLPMDEFNSLFGYGTVMADLESDALGNIYFIEQSRLGIIRFQKNRQLSLHYSPFNKLKRLWNDDLANVLVLDEQHILIGAKQGFIHYDPQKDQVKPNQTKVFFREIRNDGELENLLYSGHGTISGLSQGGEVSSFPYSQNSFTFDFGSPHFESGEEIQYQYRLQNYDVDWSDWSTDSRKEYTNLPEGEYVFSVRAKTIFDEVTEPIEYSFTIRPPFYRSVVAYMVYASLIGALLFLAFKWVDKRYKKQTLVLQQEKFKALQQKDDVIESITQRSEEEIVRLKNAQLQSEIDFKNQELTSSAMNLIQKNKLLSTIKNSLKSLTNDSLSSEMQTQLNRLVRSIDKDLEGVENWSAFAENFDQVHGKFITRLKEHFPELTAQEIKFSAYIRMNLNTKEIANLLGISVRGVEIGRYRVRKKLGLSRQDSLSDFLLRF